MLTAKDRITQAANAVLAIGAAVSILMLLYVFYHYGLMGDRTFASRNGMLMYYGVPTILLIVFLVSLRQAPPLRAGLALACLSLGFSLYVMDLAVFLFDPPAIGSYHTITTPPATTRDLRELIRVAKSFGVDFDTRPMLEVISDLREKGIDAVPSIVPAGLLGADGNPGPAGGRTPGPGSMTPVVRIDGKEVLPLAGIRNRITVLCNELGEYLRYVSDDHGFHNPKEAWNSGRADITAVGDSFVHGMCVPSDRNFVSLLRKSYPGTINLGMAGNGPLLELATLVEYAATLKPKVVLWAFYEGNDIQDVRKERNAPMLMRYLVDKDFKQGLINFEPALDTALNDLIESVYKRLLEAEEPDAAGGVPAWKLQTTAKEMVTLMHLRQRLGLVQGKRSSYDEDESVVDDRKLFEQTLRRAKEVVSGWAGSLYLVYLPERSRYVDYDTAVRNERTRQWFLKMSASAGIPVIDIHKAFEAYGNPAALFPFGRLGHYDETGNRLVAEQILRSISLTGSNTAQ